MPRLVGEDFQDFRLVVIVNELDRGLEPNSRNLGKFRQHSQQKKGVLKMSQYDISALHDFLLHTPEQGLRKMLVDNKSFSDVHFNLMLKIVRVCDSKTFCEHFEKGDFPKLKYSPKESSLKDKFWGDLISVCNSRGLLQPASAQKSAA
ncbi:MAG: hypothetical protein N2578_10170 [Bdellovibrionaceae bacterium]|nr:hypothetical protein [Pseudobdellovibrionaceae bacterium]